MCALKKGMTNLSLPCRYKMFVRSINCTIKCRQYGWQKCGNQASAFIHNSQWNSLFNDSTNPGISTSRPFDGIILETSVLGSVHTQRYYTTLSNAGRGRLNNSTFLTSKYSAPTINYPVANARYIGGLVSAIARSVLKIRYLVLGGAIGGGASLAKQYEEWKEGLPDTEWIKSLFPSNIEIDKFRSSLIKAGENIKGKANEIDIDPVLSKVEGFKEWFEKRLSAAIEATDKSPKKIVNSSKEISNGERVSDHSSLPVENSSKNDGNGSDWGNIAIPITSALAVTSVGGNDKEKDKKLEEERKKTDQERKNTEEERKKNETLQRKLEAAQEELMRTQIRYQRELEKLEKENKELKQRLLLKSNSAIAKKTNKKITNRYVF